MNGSPVAMALSGPESHEGLLPNQRPRTGDWEGGSGVGVGVGVGGGDA